MTACVNLQLLSDLHQEMLNDASLEHIAIHPNTNVLVVAGDVGRGVSELERLKALASPKRPVVAIFGNHCVVGERISELESMAQEMSSPEEGFYVLHRSSVTLFGIRFVGAILWADGMTIPDGMSFEQSCSLCAPRGFEKSELSPGVPFSFESSIVEHKKDLSYIRSVLAAPFDGPTVVITHHLPSPKSVSAEYLNFPTSATYSSKLDDLEFSGCDFWFHGHTHSSVDYYIGHCRVVCNPRGHSKVPGQWQNPRFKPELLIPVCVKSNSI